ncbi:RNA-dependent ATPase rok1 [Trapelia coarctata]|nr:RNA-dependent ATPase rok1 [Trapelia coarctata]
MDILKILTRSTNLQKSFQNSRKPTESHIPSAGASTQAHGDGEDLPSSTSLRLEVTDDVRKGTKRKRRETAEPEPPSESNDLDFFEAGGRANQKLDPARVKAHPVENRSERIAVISQSSQTMTEEDCRRILKSHKLKVTLLNGQVRKALESKVRKGSSKISKPSKKDALTQLSPQPLLAFTELRSKYAISRRLAANLDAQGYTTPTDVQLVSLPLLLGTDEDRALWVSKKTATKGKAHIDLLTVAPTGSGKTLAFLIPTLYGILQDRHTPTTSTPDSHKRGQTSAIIIAPTHELADQIVNEGKKLAAGTGLRISGMRKGMKMQFDDQREEEIVQSKLNSDNLGNSEPLGSIAKPDVLVATPGLLLNVLSETTDSAPRALSSVRYLILDEADVLLDPLFRAQTLAIWNCCINESLQTSLWSATIGSSIESLAQSTILERRHQLGLSASDHHIIRVIVGLKDSALPTVSHRLIYAATEQGKLLAIRQLLHPSTTEDAPALRPPFLVFTQTIPRAVALHSELLYDIPPEAGGSTRIAVLHSDLSDTARSNIMAQFRKGEIWVLITTDLLSRGIDFRGINGVVNYDIPNTSAAYVHRAGRTGRAGREGGIAVTLYTKDDIPYIKNIANVIAASQKLNPKTGEDSQEGVQKWLLDALPNVSKKSKKELKHKGVEARRATKTDEDGGKGARKMRISTKSGFDRRLDNKRKGAVKGSQRRGLSDEALEAVDSSDEEWGGVE